MDFSISLLCSRGYHDINNARKLVFIINLIAPGNNLTTKALEKLKTLDLIRVNADNNDLNMIPAMETVEVNIFTLLSIF